VSIVGNSKGFVKYRRVFEDLDEIAAQVEQILLQPSLSQTIRKLERGGNKNEIELKDLLNDKLRVKCSGGGKKIREYVDLASDIGDKEDI